MQTELQRQSLYHIEQEHLSILSLIEDNEGIITPELDEALQLSEVALQQKGISYGWAIKKFMNESEVIDREINRLKRLKDKSDYIADKLKEKLSDGMQMFGIEKIESPTLKLSFRKSESIEITDITKIAGKYLDEKITYTISKTKIKEDIKAGIPVTGAELIQKLNLQIR